MKIYKVESEKLLPLYRKYQGQCQPQNAYFEVDLAYGTLSCYYIGEIGNAVPSDVWHNKCLRFPVPNNLKTEDYNELMESVLELAKDLEKTYDEEWDGNNYVGIYDEEIYQMLDSAVDEFTANVDSDIMIFEDIEGYFSEVDLADWLNERVDKSIEEIEREIEQDALSNDSYIELIDLEGYLKDSYDYYEWEENAEGYEGEINPKLFEKLEA